jgi:hypothetical protein
MDRFFDNNGLWTLTGIRGVHTTQNDINRVCL